MARSTVAPESERQTPSIQPSVADARAELSTATPINRPETVVADAAPTEAAPVDRNVSSGSAAKEWTLASRWGDQSAPQAVANPPPVRLAEQTPAPQPVPTAETQPAPPAASAIQADPAPPATKSNSLRVMLAGIIGALAVAALIGKLVLHLRASMREKSMRPKWIRDAVSEDANDDVADRYRVEESASDDVEALLRSSARRPLRA